MAQQTNRKILLKNRPYFIEDYLHDVLLFVFQTVRNLVAAVLKEKGPNGQITQSSTQVNYFNNNLFFGVKAQ